MNLRGKYRLNSEFILIAIEPRWRTPELLTGANYSVYRSDIKWGEIEKSCSEWLFVFMILYQPQFIVYDFTTITINNGWNEWLWCITSLIIFNASRIRLTRARRSKDNDWCTHSTTIISEMSCIKSAAKTGSARNPNPNEPKQALFLLSTPGRHKNK